MLNFCCVGHERCFFFQWIDGADKFDPRYLLFDDWCRGRHPREHFQRWVPPPNPPPMKAKEKHLAVVRWLEEPPLCECGDRAMINPENTLEFVCLNKHEVSGKCICLNVYLYMCACTNVFSCSVMDLWSVVSMSDSMVLRINGRSHQRQRKRRKKG